MVSYDDIRELQQYPSDPDSLVLSLYINVDQSNAANLNRGFETAVENLLRQMSETDTNHNKSFEAEREKVFRFLKEYTPHGRALVIFSNSVNGFWWQRDLQVEVPTEGRISSHPWVTPLLKILEEHDRFAAVLIDKHRARILAVDAMGLEQLADLTSDVPNKHATTGTDHIWSQSQMGRDHIKHLKWHASRAAEELAGIIDRTRITKIVVGGPVEATSLFTNELPKRLQQMVIGTVAVPIDASYDRLLTELRAVRESAEREDEDRLVQSLITSAHKGDRAVLGAADTLAAIREGRVYCMVVARDFHIEGKECSRCHLLSLEGSEECSFCGGKLEPAHDLVNRASRRVLEQAGKVQLVSGDAAAKLAETGIGAVLRF
jgi:peptide subunit release factor 1 (eRF1)